MMVQNYISSLNTGIAGKVYKSGKSEITNNILDSEEAKPVDNNYRSGITIPIDKYGIFQVMSYNKNNFTHKDLELAELLISYTSVNLQRIKAQKEIVEISNRDFLTKLYNRRYFDKKLKNYDCKKYLPLSIIIGDLNDFKYFNDKYGHIKGDELLKKVGENLKMSCRERDIVARIGGDEFGFILPNTKFESAKKIRTRIFNNLNKTIEYDINIALGLATKNNIVENIREFVIKVQYAIGVAQR